MFFHEIHHYIDDLLIKMLSSCQRSYFYMNFNCSDNFIKKQIWKEDIKMVLDKKKNIQNVIFLCPKKIELFDSEIIKIIDFLTFFEIQ